MDSADAVAAEAPSRAAEARRARIAELRAQEHRRTRRVRLLAVLTAAAALAACAAGAVWAVDTARTDKPTAASAIPGVQTFTGLGRTHVSGPVHYPQTPPVGGNHNPVWLDCMGTVYDKPVADENAVHSLEHGAVWVTYNSKASTADIRTLADKVRTTPYSFMSPYPSEKGAITLTAWGTQLVVDSAADPRVERFFTAYVQGPQTQEPGASCSPGSM